MEGHKGGSSTPSYNQAVSTCNKKPLEVEQGFLGGGKQVNGDKQEKNNRWEEARRETGIEKNN